VSATLIRCSISTTSVRAVHVSCCSTVIRPDGSDTSSGRALLDRITPLCHRHAHGRLAAYHCRVLSKSPSQSTYQHQHSALWSRQHARVRAHLVKQVPGGDIPGAARDKFEPPSLPPNAHAHALYRQHIVLIAIHTCVRSGRPGERACVRIGFSLTARCRRPAAHARCQLLVGRAANTGNQSQDVARA
jgi:hypothetical protein